MSNVQRWIDADDLYSVGQTGFLIERDHVRGPQKFFLSDDPPVTNQSRELRPVGWCGCTNDVHTVGHGIWKIVRIARNGRAKCERVMDRCQISEILEDLGYPDLEDECLTAL